MTLSDKDATRIAAITTLVVDIVWTAARDLHEFRSGVEPTSAYEKWMRECGYTSPVEEIEEFWGPNEACRIYLSLLTDISPEAVCARVLESGGSRFLSRQKISISSNIKRKDADRLLDAN